MDLRRVSLVLYIIFVFQDNLSSVSSSVDTNHETLPIDASKPDVVRFEGNSLDLAVVIKRALRGGGGRGGGGGGRSSGGGSGGSRSSSGERGGGGSQSQTRGGPRVVPVHTGNGGSHHSSGRTNLRGTVCAVGWLTLSVLVGLFLVR